MAATPYTPEEARELLREAEARRRAKQGAIQNTLEAYRGRLRSMVTDRTSYLFPSRYMFAPPNRFNPYRPR